MVNPRLSNYLLYSFEHLTHKHMIKCKKVSSSRQNEFNKMKVLQSRTQKNMLYEVTRLLNKRLLMCIDDCFTKFVVQFTAIYKGFCSY